MPSHVWGRQHIPVGSYSHNRALGLRKRSSNCLQSRAGSDGRRNTCLQSRCRRLETQGLSGTLIQAQRDLDELRLRDWGKVGSSGEVLSQE
jgi:hypothetical protein